MILFQVVGMSLGMLSMLFGQTCASLAGAIPKSYGIVLFRAFDAVDVNAPAEVLYYLGQMHETQIAWISETLDPVTTEPVMAAMNPRNSTSFMSIVPTHTFETAPELDVLIIPGGAGVRSPLLNSTLKYIRETTPKVKHVITICTGAALAARAGVMDGRKATTNKSSWPNVIPYGPNTTWVPHARWVEDESREPPIWSSSGVTAGFDLMFHFTETFYGSQNTTWIANIMEYVRHTDPNDDPFARNETTVVPALR